MEAMMKQISKRKNHQDTFNTHGYMPRVYEVRAPCQWLNHCEQGKCPAFVRLNGNFYCAKSRITT
jgi:hypothetical protein